MQPSDEPGPQLDRSLLRGLEGLIARTDRLDWSREYPRLQLAMKNIWARHGWTNEADRFALELACEIAAVPPWEPFRRINLLHERIEQRYGLAGESRAKFRAMMVREMTKFLMRHADVVTGQAQEWLDMRADERPFTAEQAARWATQGRSLVEDLRATSDRMVKELAPSLDAAARQVLDRDAASLRKRQAAIEKMADRWIEGQWEPIDWGLQHDPIQQRLTAPTAALQATTPVAPEGIAPHITVSWRTEPMRPLPYDPRTWHVFVEEFKGRFRLDPAQRTTADSIHAELLERALSYMESHAGKLQAVPARDRLTHENYEPVRALFEELTRRLDGIPTTSQQVQSVR